MNKTKLLLLLALLAGVAAFFALDLGRYFSLAYVKKARPRSARCMPSGLGP